MTLWRSLWIRSQQSEGSGMNLPNKLTMLRVVMIPFFVAAMLLSRSGMAAVYINQSFTYGPYIGLRLGALVIFCLASFTDYLDGHIARKRGLVTNFGKFMDPLADKLLVCSALILLTAEGSLSPIVTLIIVAREFIISGFRLVASDNGVVIAASKWGKLKTVVQMLMCILLIFPYTAFYEHQYIFGSLPWLTVGALMTVIELLAVAFTIISLIDYIVKNIRVITEGGM